MTAPDLLYSLGRCSAQAGILVMLVLAAQSLFPRQLSPRWRCALWLLVAVRLLLPVSLSSVTSIYNVMPAWGRPVGPAKAAAEAPQLRREKGNEATPVVAPAQTGAGSSRLQEEAGTAQPAPEAAQPQEATELAPLRGGVGATFPPEKPATPPASFNWPRLLVAVWLAGVAILGAGLVVSTLALVRRIRGAPRLADARVEALLRSAREELGRSIRTPAVFECAWLDSPALYGCWRPRLLLPVGFAGRFSAEELRFVFLHELAHVRRRDLAVNWLLALLQVVHWFNPFVWYAFHRWRTDRELACDAMVLEAAGPAHQDAYGRTILHILESFARGGLTPGLVGIVENKRRLRERINFIATFASRPRWSWLAVGLLGALGVIGLTDAQVAAPSTKAASAPTATGLSKLGVVDSARSVVTGPTTPTSMIMQKLDAIIIPEVNFNNVALELVVQTLNQLSVQFDSSGDASAKGVKIVMTEDIANGTVKILLRNLSLHRVLDLVTQKFGCQYEVHPDVVVIGPAEPSPPSGLNTDAFSISKSTIARITSFSSDDPALDVAADRFAGADAPQNSPAAALARGVDSAIRDFFQKAGVNFAGVKFSALAYDGSSIIVTQTARNLDQIRNILSRYTPITQIHIEVNYIELNESDVAALGFPPLGRSTVTLTGQGGSIGSAAPPDFIEVRAAPVSAEATDPAYPLRPEHIFVGIIDVRAKLLALSKASGFQLLSSSSVTVQSGNPANISYGLPQDKLKVTPTADPDDFQISLELEPSAETRGVLAKFGASVPASVPASFKPVVGEARKVLVWDKGTVVLQFPSIPNADPNAPPRCLLAFFSTSLVSADKGAPPLALLKEAVAAAPLTSAQLAMLQGDPYRVAAEWLHPPLTAAQLAVMQGPIAATVSKLAASTGIHLVPIPAGTFLMGSPDDEPGRAADEGPRTRVILTRFFLGATDVTQKQYEAVMGKNPSTLKSAGPDAPVETVSERDGIAFCQKLTEQERTAGRLPDGYAFTLPTEAQWEYACRAGTTGPYPGDLDAMAWFSKNSGGTTHPVATKQPNEWGLFDMLGNVSQWCSDSTATYPGGQVTDPVGPTPTYTNLTRSGIKYLARGGFYRGSEAQCRSASRQFYPGFTSAATGFRIALVRLPDAPATLMPAPPLTAAQQAVLQGPIADAVSQLVASIGIHLVPIPAGTFLMGSPRDEKGATTAESPQVNVTLTQDFFFGATSVTQGQWMAVMGNNPAHFQGTELPVDQVTWNDAMAFCQKLTERERAAGRLPAGHVFTLPTEAQWEYACRAGTTGPYAGDFEAMAWYLDNSGGTTHRVGTKQPNAWGLYDMHGNVSEWCADWFRPIYFGGTDPQGPGFGTERVSRGGDWRLDAVFCRSACRHNGPNGRSGVRVALVRLPASDGTATPVAPLSSPAANLSPVVGTIHLSATPANPSAVATIVVVEPTRGMHFPPGLTGGAELARLKSKEPLDENTLQIRPLAVYNFLDSSGAEVDYEGVIRGAGSNNAYDYVIESGGTGHTIVRLALSFGVAKWVSTQTNSELPLILKNLATLDLVKAGAYEVRYLVGHGPPSGGIGGSLGVGQIYEQVWLKSLTASPDLVYPVGQNILLPEPRLYLADELVQAYRAKYGTYKLSGTVVDQNGLLLAHTAVVFILKDGSVEATTDSVGMFTLKLGQQFDPNNAVVANYGNLRSAPQPVKLALAKEAKLAKPLKLAVREVGDPSATLVAATAPASATPDAVLSVKAANSSGSASASSVPGLSAVSTPIDSPTEQWYRTLADDSLDGARPLPAELVARFVAGDVTAIDLDGTRLWSRSHASPFAGGDVIDRDIASRKLTPEELKYLALQQARRTYVDYGLRWVEAAESMVQRGDQPDNNLSSDGYWEGMMVKIPAQSSIAVNPGLNGEALRAKSVPSVAELLDRRLQRIMPTEEEWVIFGGNCRLDNTLRMATALARWDGKTASPGLQAFTAWLKQRLASEERHPETDNAGKLVEALVNLYYIRAAAGDATAWEEYAGWLQTTKPDDLSDPHYAFIPAWVNPHHPAVAQALSELFTRPGSPWLPLMQPHLGRMALMGMMFGTPVIDVPSFRQAIISGLSDLTPAGTATMAGGGVEIAVDGYSPIPAFSDFPPRPLSPGPDVPPLGSKVTIRMGDFYAYELKQAYLQGCPDFALYWPEAKRDQALAAIKAFLQQPGNLGHTGSWRL